MRCLKIWLLLQELLRDMGIKVLIKDGIEADDIVGTLAKRFDLDTVIVSGDKDLLQLIDEHTKVWLTRKGISETEVFDLAHFREVYGFEPPQMVDLKSMMGDSELRALAKRRRLNLCTHMARLIIYTRTLMN